MTPQPGQHIKCFLRTGSVVEGTVENWGESIVLKTLDRLSLMIIHNPQQDIILTKVLLDPPDPKSRAQEIPGAIVTKAIEDGQPPPDEQSLNAMTKAQLHIELVEQERRTVAEKLRDHYPNPTAPRRRTYGYPGFLKKPRVE